MKRFFVTGTDTNVGKTVACAWLLQHWKGDYWKPVQSGIQENKDCDEILRLTHASSESIHDSTYELNAPLSPHESARLENRSICLEDFVLPQTTRTLIIEGAGGIYVPLNSSQFIIDFIQYFSLPVIVVARSSLGTINHTLLTLEALHARNIPVKAVILNGQPNLPNRQAIEKHGRVPIIGEIPRLCPLNYSTLSKITPPPAPENIL